MLNIRLREEETAIRQIEALGFQASDVRHIIATHLDFDHAGGLEDFPGATVHVMAREYDDATRPHSGFVARNRWRMPQLNEVADWRRYGARGEDWFGFEAVRDLDSLPPEILMVPLPGHTWGHAGVAVRQDGGRWLLHAGDAYFYRGEMREAERRCTPGLRAYQRLMEADARSRIDNQARLRRLSIERRDAVTVTCTHDPVELARLQAGDPL
jgi:glyoxylase-like metal-dependent hydrolase (beta-lactamase superfamily II)